MHRRTVRRLVKLQLPAASPSIFTGFRISAGYDRRHRRFFFSRVTPVGKLITYFFVNNQAGPMFITSICAALLGLSLFIVFGAINKIAVGRWYDEAAKF